MKHYKGKLSKKALLDIPDGERKLFISIAHLQNEIRFSLYGVVWTRDFNSEIDAVVKGQISFNFFHLKVLAGKLHEGWRLLIKHFYSNKELSIEFNSKGSEEAKALLSDLKRYFKRTNVISEIRNNLSFHYSPEELANQLEETPDELEMYIAKENDTNTLYYFAEVLANRSVLSKIQNQDSTNPIEVINNELVDVAKKFNKFNILYMKYIVKKYAPEIWDGSAEEIEIEGLMRFSDVHIPFFTETKEGFR